MSAVMYEGKRHEASNRAFSYAVICSIVLHGLLLLAMPMLRQSSKHTEAAPGPIVARLAQPRVAPASPAPAQTEPPVTPKVEQPPPPPVTKPAPVVPSPMAKPAPAPKAERTPTKPAPSAPSTPPPTNAAPAAEPAAAPPGVAPPSTAKADPQPPAASAPAAPSAEDAGSLAQYRLQLITAARRYKRYPRIAMDNNWEGTAEIRMIVGANGMISSLIVKKGSGHDILDQEALQWIKKAKPLAPIPAALRGKEFIVDIPVIFNLKEPDAG